MADKTNNSDRFMLKPTDLKQLKKGKGKTLAQLLEEKRKARKNKKKGETKND